MKLLAQKVNLKLEQFYYDSTSIQFWGSEQYKCDIPLIDQKSYAINPKKSIFSKKQMDEFSRESKHLNKLEQGDQIVFYFKK